MAQHRLPSWLVDVRFWMTIYIFAFWPVVWFFHIAGCIALLVGVFALWWVLQAIDRRGTPNRSDEIATP
jgi:hypothetical protein